LDVSANFLNDVCRTEKDVEKEFHRCKCCAYKWPKKFYNEGLNRLRIDLEHTDQQMYPMKYVLIRKQEIT
jgi:hypothetical protein